MAKSLLYTLLIASAIVTGLFFSRNAWRQAHDQENRTAKVKSRLKEADQELVKLTTEQALLDSPAGKEALARENAMRKKDEVLVDEMKKR